MIKAGTSAPTEGRPLDAAVRTLPLPTEPMARLWHGANLLREHRGDGHVAALVTLGIGGTEAYAWHALRRHASRAVRRVSHLPLSPAGGGRRRDAHPRPISVNGWLTAAGRQPKERVETFTDELAAPAYDILEPDELDHLIEDLEPLAAVLIAAGSQ